AGGRRPILSDAFWLDSAAGAMLQTHAALAPQYFPRTAGRRVDRVRHDLRARREGRHEDVFRSPVAGRTAGRIERGADVLCAADSGGSVIGAARAATGRPGRRLPLLELRDVTEAGRKLH